MADTAGYVAKLAAWLAGDPNMDYAKEAFWVPGLQIVQDEIISELYQNPNIARLKFAVVLPNVAAGTTDLKPWFTGDNEPSLALLKSIVSLREKPTGANDAKYQDLTIADDLPVRTQVSYNSEYVWTGDTILLPGATQALDIRVWGVFDVVKIVGGDSPIIPNCRDALTKGLAVALSEAHGNDTKIERLSKKFADAKFNLLNNIMLEMQIEESRQRPYGELSGTLE